MRSKPLYHGEISTFVARIESLMRLVQDDRDAILNSSIVKQGLSELKIEMKDFSGRCEDYSAKRAVGQALHYLPKLNTKPKARWFDGFYGANIDLTYYLDHN